MKKTIYLSPTTYHTEKVPHIFVSDQITKIADSNDSNGTKIKGLLPWQNRWPTQFGIFFIKTYVNPIFPFAFEKRMITTFDLVRDIESQSEKNRIKKVQITIGGQNIFKEGPMDWRDTLPTDKMIWQTQKDYWGNKNNSNRHNSCVEDPKDLHLGQKWAWISLDCNYNGGEQAIEFLDEEVEITVWGKYHRSAYLVCWYMEPWAYHVKNGAKNEWIGPDRLITPTVQRDYYKCYNVKGGPVVA